MSSKNYEGRTLSCITYNESLYSNSPLKQVYQYKKLKAELDSAILFNCFYLPKTIYCI